MAEMQDSPHSELASCQQELEASLARLRQLESLFVHIADPIFVTELNGYIIDANTAASKALGYTRDELLSFHLWDLMPGAPKEEILNLVEGGLPGVPITLQRRCRAKSGAEPIIDLSLARCVLEDRHLIVVTCRDATTQYRANERLESALAAVRESEEHLQRNEAYLVEAQRLSRTGSFGWNVVTDELFWSAETFCILGYSQGTAPTLDHVFQRIHPKDTAFARETIDRAARDEAGLDFELRLMMPDGTVKHVHVLAKPTRTRTGAVEFIGALMDITDWRRAEEALRRSEAYLTEAQRLSGTGSWCLRPASQEIIFSAQTVRIGGWDPGTIPSLETVLERIHPDDRSQVQASLEKALQDESFLEYEHRLLMSDGTIRHVHTVANPVMDALGQLEFVGAVVDITGKKKAEDALHATAEALRRSEHLARGQLEVLTSTLTVLSREAKPEKFLEHILRTMCGQLEAYGIGVWVVNEKTGFMDLVADYEQDRLRLPTPEQMQINPIIDIGQKDHPVWRDFFNGTIRCVYGKLNSASPWVCIAKDPNGPWFDNMGSPAASPLLSKICEHISAEGVVATICIPMLVAGKVTGFFSIRFQERRPLRHEEIELTQAMAHQGTLAIRLMRLSQQSREAAVMTERNRMARDIHDTLAQGFTGVIVQLEVAKGALERHDVAGTNLRIERASELARSSLREARRSVLALRPRSLQSGTLCAALEDLLKQMTEGSRLQAAFQVMGDERVMPSQWEEDLLRIAQEALTNTIKHGQAHNFRAVLRFGPDEIELQLLDDGSGFNVETEHEGFGLIGMKERVERMNGRFTICSKPGRGAEIRVILSIPTVE